MSAGRRTGWFLVAMAVWNFFIWLTFAKNLHAAYADGEDRATGYWVAHTILIVVDLVIAVVLARLGLRLVRSPQTQVGPSVPAADSTDTPLAGG